MSAASRYLPVVAGAIAGGAIALAISSGGSSRNVTTTVMQPPAAAVQTSLRADSGLTVRQIAKAAEPGVVDIKVDSTVQTPGAFGLGGSQSQSGEGAGAVYDSAGHVVTDEHVVANATSVKVTFSDGKSFPATVIGTDKSTDIGVIKVSAPASEFHVLALADSAKAQIGDGVVAIGSPFGLPGTVTTGIVSQVGRSIPAPNGFTITNAVQTDAAINPGNSGGPLLDTSGHVLGLNDQIETNTQQNAGVGFAVPSNTVRRVADSLIAGHQPAHSYVGVRLDSTGAGATVATVAAGGPADAAGIKPNDVILSVNGQSVGSTDDFISRVDQLNPGDSVNLVIRRGGGSRTVSVKLGNRPGG